MNYLISLLILLYSQSVFAGLLDVFRLEDGHTNWQYVANTGGSIFIVALSLTALRLFFSRREVRRYNLELETIRRELEDRVKKRTATLDESNRKLQESNQALESEITEHRATTHQLQLSESYINNILRCMPLMLIGLDKNGAVTQWNHRAEEISGLKADEVLGNNLWQAYPTITVTPQQINQAEQQNKTITIKHSQRGQYHFDITIYPLDDQSETGVVILIDDVTQRILAENMLIQRDKMSSMGELAATMAHDINTPLQYILDDVRKVQLLLKQQGITEPELARLLHDASLSGKQASSVINNLLEFSRSRGGEKKPANITRLIDESIQLANNVLSVPSGLKFQDIHIDKQYGEQLPQIPCYEAELKQVFLSLFRNAFGALSVIDDSEHKPEIKILAGVFYEALWIKIQHNGKGMSLEEQQYILEPFFSNDSSMENYDLGKRLSFSHFIITEQHRGEMAVTSDVNVGTTFHLQLQLK